MSYSSTKYKVVTNANTYVDLTTSEQTLAQFTPAISGMYLIKAMINAYEQATSTAGARYLEFILYKNTTMIARTDTSIYNALSGMLDYNSSRMFWAGSVLTSDTIYLKGLASAVSVARVACGTGSEGLSLICELMS
jgi:hypothetical protein